MIFVVQNCSSSSGKKYLCCLEACCEHFKFTLTAEPPTTPDRRQEAEGGPCSCTLHRTPPDVIHTLEADKAMSQTSKTI